MAASIDTSHGPNVRELIGRWEARIAAEAPKAVAKPSRIPQPAKPPKSRLPRPKTASKMTQTVALPELVREPMGAAKLRLSRIPEAIGWGLRGRRRGERL